jgi:dTDP-4-dehydrorhamnose reductase
MAKVVIEFNLDNADDKREYYQYNKSEDMAMFIWQLAYNTKKELEYDIEAKGKISNYDVLDMIFEHIYKMLEDNDINVNKLG